jgi:hypothetical protein
MLQFELTHYKTKQNKGCITLGPGHLHLKSILRQKKNNHENSSISPPQNIIFKKSSKTNQNPSRYYNFITNLKFQHKPKNIIFQKSSYKKKEKDLLLLPRGQNLLSYYYTL